MECCVCKQQGKFLGWERTNTNQSGAGEVYDGEVCSYNAAAAVEACWECMIVVSTSKLAHLAVSARE